MDILYLLVPMSAMLVLGILGVFAWALNGGQFEDLDRHGEEILSGDTDAFDRHQDPHAPPIEESVRRH